MHIILKQYKEESDIRVFAETANGLETSELYKMTKFGLVNEFRKWMDYRLKEQ